MSYDVVKHDEIVPNDVTSPDNWVPSLDDPEVPESNSCIAVPFIMNHQRYMKNGILYVVHNEPVLLVVLCLGIVGDVPIHLFVENTSTI